MSIYNLNQRSLEVLSYIARGYNNQAIATGMGIKHKTLKKYINNIYTELYLQVKSSYDPRVKATLMYKEYLNDVR